jgi:excisionase family DNA binding protein
MVNLPDKSTYRISEIAYYYGVTERTIYLWIENNHLKTILTPSGLKRITKESLDECRFAPRREYNASENFKKNK